MNKLIPSTSYVFPHAPSGLVAPSSAMSMLGGKPKPSTGTPHSGHSPAPHENGTRTASPWISKPWEFSRGSQFHLGQALREAPHVNAATTVSTLLGIVADDRMDTTPNETTRNIFRGNRNNYLHHKISVQHVPVTTWDDWDRALDAYSMELAGTTYMRMPSRYQLATDFTNRIRTLHPEYSELELTKTVMQQMPAISTFLQLKFSANFIGTAVVFGAIWVFPGLAQADSLGIAEATSRLRMIETLRHSWDRARFIPPSAPHKLFTGLIALRRLAMPGLMLSQYTRNKRADQRGFGAEWELLSRLPKPVRAAGMADIADTWRITLGLNDSLLIDPNRSGRQARGYLRSAYPENARARMDAWWKYTTYKSLQYAHLPKSTFLRAIRKATHGIAVQQKGALAGSTAAKLHRQQALWLGSLGYEAAKIAAWSGALLF